MRLQCRLFGHRWSFPTPSPGDIMRWTRGDRPTRGLFRTCYRCNAVQEFTIAGTWRDIP